MKLLTIITAAGKGIRYGSFVPKQLQPFGTSTVLEHTIKKFSSFQHNQLDICSIIPVSDENGYNDIKKISTYVVQGGSERQSSIANAVLSDFSANYDYILVHDGVRPLISHSLIAALLTSVREYKAVIPVLPVKETIKQVKDDKIIHTLNRSSLVAVQTPQIFSSKILIDSYQKAVKLNTLYTDDAALVEAAGYDVYCIQGEETNIKITTQFDMDFANFLINSGLAS